MLRRAALAGALIASVSCNRSEGGDSAGSALVASAGSAKAAGPGGSFSADLARELAGPDKGSGAARAEDPAGAGSSAGRAGSATTGDPRASDVPSGGAASDPRAGDSRSSGAAGGDRAGGDKAGSGAQSTAQAAGDKAAAGKPASADTASAGKPGATAAEPPAEVSGAPGRGPVKVPADLAAIRLSLLPNWDRDIGQPGTFQYVVRIKGTQNTKTFTFHYGYDDPRAPRDHEQYKKYLQDTRALTGEIRDRQRGAAWFLEGSDAAGMPAFRYVVLYGGKQLICYGSLYKDADSNRLGDDRDQTLIQAKQICETLAL